LKNKAAIALVILTGMMFHGCASRSGHVKNNGDVDESWSGIWRGRTLLLNSMAPPRNVDFEIYFTNTSIKGFLTDSTDNLIQFPVQKLSLDRQAISFRMSFDTKRGLRANVYYSGVRKGRHLMLDFVAMEGGRRSSGKFQARQIENKRQAPPEISPDSTASSLRSSSL